LIRSLAAALAASFVLVASSASALDKQGSAHGGDVGKAPGEEDDLNFSGALTLGSSIINKSYAARPDNSGIALMRYAAHGDLDLIGRKLSIPLDINMFTDRERKGAGVFIPSEFDVIGGVTTTGTLAKGADLEVGARVEHDRTVDGKGDDPGFSQTYSDIRARLLYSLGQVFPKLKDALIDGDISGYATLGYFVVNPTYAARPDNTGSALFRYVGHSELSIYKDYLSIGLDGTFFTDRRQKPIKVFAPSELDVTYEIIGRYDPFEVHLAYERDMPIDRGGKVQDFVYLLLVYGFDFKHKQVAPLEQRGTIPSP
jgi:hypothetical protein